MKDYFYPRIGLISIREVLKRTTAAKAAMQSSEMVRSSQPLQTLAPVQVPVAQPAPVSSTDKIKAALNAAFVEYYGRGANDETLNGESSYYGPNSDLGFVKGNMLNNIKANPDGYRGGLLPVSTPAPVVTTAQVPAPANSPLNTQVTLTTRDTATGPLATPSGNTGLLLAAVGVGAFLYFRNKKK